MKQIQIVNTSLNVSEFCLGCMQLGAMTEPEPIRQLVHAFRNAGGNFFDTAHCYCSWLPSGAGASEVRLGNYIKENNCRDQVILATKGGHPTMERYRTVTNYMSRARIEADIDDSLGRLQTDVIDLYWLHRDDPQIDVGTILDILNAEVKRGRIRYFGGSNWTSQRLHEANVYAKKHGISGFVASQPQWSLLQYSPMSQTDRLKPGTLLHVDDADRQWHKQSRIPLIPYGSTGNGFFASNGKQPEKYQSPENQARCHRATELAAQKQATPTQVALAWLLAQPFPVVPILGTSKVEHLEEAMKANSLSLTQKEVLWLEKGL